MWYTDPEADLDVSQYIHKNGILEAGTWSFGAHTHTHTHTRARARARGAHEAGAHTNILIERTVRM